MARKRINKDGSVVYEIRVSRGYDATGKRRTPFQMTWKAPDGWSQKSIERELQRVQAQFENDCRAGKILTVSERKEKAIKDAEEKAAEEDRLLTFDKYKDIFIKNHATVYSVNTLTNYRFVLNEASKIFGKIKMVDIRTVDLKNYLSDVQQNEKNQFSGQLLSHGTIIKKYTVLHSFFESAVEDEIIEYSPMRNVKRPKPRKDEEKNKSPKSYDVDQIRLIMNALQNEKTEWRAIIQLMIDTGCRRGEIMGLKWECIDFDNSEITIKYNAQYSKDRGVYLTTPKNGKSRTIRINPPVVKVLKEWKREQAALLFRPGVGMSDYVFTYEDGRIMNPQAPTGFLKRLGQKCGIPSLHPHALRHTMASLSIANGADVVSVSKKLGHSEVSTTLNIYAHENEEAKNRTAKILCDAIYTERA